MGCRRDHIGVVCSNESTLGRNIRSAKIKWCSFILKCEAYHHLNSCANLCFLEIQVCSKEEAIFVLHLICKTTESLVPFLSHLVKIDLDIIFPS